MWTLRAGAQSLRGHSWSVLSARAGFLPGPEHLEVADLLLRKAGDDAVAARILASHADVADHAIGFHAQQAVEKNLPSVGLPRTAGLEGRMGHQAPAAPRRRLGDGGTQ